MRLLKLWCAVLVLLLAAVLPAVADGPPGGTCCNFYYTEVMTAPSPDTGGAPFLHASFDSAEAPSNSQMQAAYAAVCPGGFYTTMAVETDTMGNPIGSQFFQSGAF